MGTKNWWSPHPLDKHDQWRLLEIAESANPPGSNPLWFSDIEFKALDGWKVVFFYDCGELDYIDHFITPEGERLEVWVDGYVSEEMPPVMIWRGKGGLKRLAKDREGSDMGVKEGECTQDQRIRDLESAAEQGVRDRKNLLMVIEMLGAAQGYELERIKQGGAGW